MFLYPCFVELSLFVPMLWLEVNYDNKGEKGRRSLLPGPPARDRCTRSLLLPVHKGRLSFKLKAWKKTRPHTCVQAVHCTALERRSPPWICIFNFQQMEIKCLRGGAFTPFSLRRYRLETMLKKSSFFKVSQTMVLGLTILESFGNWLKNKDFWISLQTTEKGPGFSILSKVSPGSPHI